MLMPAVTPENNTCRPLEGHLHVQSNIYYVQIKAEVYLCLQDVIFIKCIAAIFIIKKLQLCLKLEFSGSGIAPIVQYCCFVYFQLRWGLRLKPITL